jgi:hypothetical protein
LPLQAANAALTARAEAGRLAALSFAEGVPSRVTALLPRLIVVPPESAYPGFGEFVPLADLDHIQVGRPASFALCQSDRVFAYEQLRLPVTCQLESMMSSQGGPQQLLKQRCCC